MTIRQIQCLLAYLGYDPGTIDGAYGPKTLVAVQAFQQAEGLEPDGIAGQQTQARLREAVASGEKPVGDKMSATADWWKDIRYFTRNEFRCTCPRCGGFPVEPEETMVRVVDEIRRRAGTPITIVDSGGSGIRCPEHNVEVGGVANSEHLYGRAADLHSNLSPAELYRIAEEVTKEMIPGRGGIGIYRWGIHVDTGAYSRWNG